MIFRFFWVFTISILFTSCGKSQSSCVSINANKAVAMYCDMSTRNILHRLYFPSEINEAPHPFYKKMEGQPVSSYEDACGKGSFLFDPDTNELYFAIAYSQLSGAPAMMHFHLGDASTGGPIIQTIFGMPSGNVKGLGYSPEPPISCSKGLNGRSGFVTGVYKLKGNAELTPPLTLEAEKEALMNGNIYVNIHTYLNEQGEVRGQINPCGF